MTDAIAPRLAGPDKRVQSLMRLHSAAVTRKLRRLGVPPHTLDDAAQHVFWVAARRLDQLEPGVEVAFLLTTAVRVASDVRRVEARRTRREVELDQDHDCGLQLEDLLDLKRAKALLQGALADMTPDLAAIYVMSETEGLTATEISHQTGAPIGTVASRLRRARAFVQQRVRRFRYAPRKSQELA